MTDAAAAEEETLPEQERLIERIRQRAEEQFTEWRLVNQRAFSQAAEQLSEQRQRLEVAAQAVMAQAQEQMKQNLLRYQQETMEDIRFRRTILEKQKAQMDSLRNHVSANMAGMSHKKAQLVEQQLMLLAHTLLSKQDRLVQEEEAVTRQSQARLDMLTRSIEQKNQLLHEQYVAGLKDEFSHLLSDLYQKQKEMDADLAERVRKQRTHAERLAVEARQALELAKEEYRQKHQQNVHYLQKSMHKCRELLQRGFTSEAYQLQKEVIAKVSALQNQVHAAFRDSYQRLRLPLIVLNETEKSSVERLSQQGEALFANAKEILEEQWLHLTDSQQDVLLKEIEQHAVSMETACREQLQFGDQTRERMLEKLQQKMNKLMQQRQQQCERQHDGILVSARNQVIELERDTITFRQKFIEEQKHILQGSELLLQQLEMDKSAFQNLLKDQELAALKEEARQIQSLVARLDEKHRAQWEGQRHKVIDAKLKVGHHFAHEHEANEKRSHDQQQQTMQLMIQRCNELVSNYSRIEQRQKQLMLDEKDELRELLKANEEQKKQVKLRDAARRKRAQDAMEITTGRAEARKEKIHLERKKLLSGLGQLPPGDPETELRKRQVNMMRQRLSEEAQELDQKITEAKRLYREACDFSQQLAKDELKSLQMAHEQDIAVIKEKMAERQQQIRNDDQRLQQEHRELKEEMDRRSNSQFAGYKDEQRELFKEAQRQLHQLEKNLLPSRAVMAESTRSQ